MTTMKTATAGGILKGHDLSDRPRCIALLVDAGLFSYEDAQVEVARRANLAAKLATNSATREEEAETDRETAARLAKSVELFQSTDGIAFATITINGHRENVRVRSQRFKFWLVREFREVKGKAPSSDALSIAQTDAESVAMIDGAAHEVFTRVGHLGDRVYVDLGDEQWRAVEVDEGGWRVVTDPPVKFQRAADALPLPEPVCGGSLDALRPFVNAPGDDAWAMLKAWLVGAMATTGPYPLLVLFGEQGSAKSTTTRRLREVIDPARTVTRETPKNSHDLAIAAKRCRVLAYDNLSYLSAEMSDAFCRLATGGGLGTRRLYSDDEESTFYAQRPIIVNGIEEVATRGDLLSRALVVNLPTLAAVKDERTMDAAWSAAHPAILGALLDATAQALAGWEATELEQAPRMADFARWVVASGAVPGFLGLYLGNREDAIGAELDSSQFATALLAFVGREGSWEGTSGELLRKLNEWEPDRPAKGWPTTPKATGDRVRRHSTALRSRGVEVSDRRSNGRRLIKLTGEKTEASALAL